MTTIATMPTGPALFVRGIARTVSWGVYDAADDAVTPTAVDVHVERNGATVATLTGTPGAGTASTTWTPPASTALADDYVLVWRVDDYRKQRRQNTTAAGRVGLPAGAATGHSHR
jgi:hypothetical protein